MAKTPEMCAHIANNPRSVQNLLLRPAKPAKGNGRVQKALKRLAQAVQREISTSEGKAWTGSHRIAVRHALTSLGARIVGRAKTVGRPSLWLLDGSESGSKQKIDE
jgi:hypothetical protein